MPRPRPGGPARSPSLDTAEGFEAHRAWERAMYDARWSVVSWPEEYGGRGAGLLEWLIFEEEYYRAEAPTRVGQNGIFLLAPTLFEFGTPRAEGALSPRHGVGRGDLVPGLVRARRRERPRRHPEPGHRLRHAGGRGRPGSSTGRRRGAHAGAFADWIFGLFRSDPEAERHRGLTYFLVPMDSPGRDGPAHRPARRRDRVRRGVLRGRGGPRRPGARGRGRGLEGGHGHGGVRAGPVVAQPGALHRGRGAARRALPPAGRGGPGRARPATPTTWRGP